jgi:hypothetical protein
MGDKFFRLVSSLTKYRCDKSIWSTNRRPNHRFLAPPPTFLFLTTRFLALLRKNQLLRPSFCHQTTPLAFGPQCKAREQKDMNPYTEKPLALLNCVCVVRNVVTSHCCMEKKTSSKLVESHVVYSSPTVVVTCRKQKALRVLVVDVRGGQKQNGSPLGETG